MPVTRSPDSTATVNKVPAVTLACWIIKICATTVGETAADVLSTTMHRGLGVTSVVMTILLIIALFAQLQTNRFVPSRS